jgi:hypothetical protein
LTLPEQLRFPLCLTDHRRVSCRRVLIAYVGNWWSHGCNPLTARVHSPIVRGPVSIRSIPRSVNLPSRNESRWTTDTEGYVILRIAHRQPYFYAHAGSTGARTWASYGRPDESQGHTA